MPIIVEDGTGLSDADSYISVSASDSYHQDRGNDAWASLTTEEKEEALRKATQYIDTTYCFYGSIAKNTQSLSWPRNDVKDVEGRDLTGLVPRAVQDATRELGLYSLTQPLSPNKTRNDYIISQEIAKLKLKYSESASKGTRYTLVDSMLSGLFKNKKIQTSTIMLDRV